MKLRIKSSGMSGLVLIAALAGFVALTSVRGPVEQAEAGTCKGPAIHGRSIAIAGIHMGMTQSKVRKLVGRPYGQKLTAYGKMGSGWWERWLTWNYHGGRSVVFWWDNCYRTPRVKEVVTRNPNDQAGNGVHVGTRRGVVARKFRKLSCWVEGSGRRETVCVWYYGGAGRCAPTLRFRFKNNRAKSISLADTDAKGGCPVVFS